MIALLVIVVLVIVALFFSLYIVQQQQAYVVERLGRFCKVSHSGLHARIPVIDRIAGKLSLKVIQLDNHFNTKTRDNVFVTVHVPVQYKVDPNNVQVAFYELQNPEQQIRAYIEDVLRTSICDLDLDDTFNNKDQIATQVYEALSAKMTQFGFIIISTLVTSIDPDDRIREAMNSINESQRKKIAARELAEAEKITVTTAAEADAEAAKLRGEGIANQRTEIIKGLAESVAQLRDSGLSSQEIMSVLMINQYLDTLNDFARAGNSSIFLPGGPEGVESLRAQILSAMEAAKTQPTAGSPTIRM